MPTTKGTLTERVADLERQIEEMRAMMATHAIQSEAQKRNGKSESHATARGSAAAVKPEKKAVASDEVGPEILAVIAAAVAHFMGKSARIRSARLVHATGTSPWAQQGRVFVQASHNLAMAR